MILLFGQHPQRGILDRQYPLHSRVGSVGDITPNPPTEPWAEGGSFPRPAYIRRQNILSEPTPPDEDLIIAIAAFSLLSSNK